MIHFSLHTYADAIEGAVYKTISDEVTIDHTTTHTFLPLLSLYLFFPPPPSLSLSQVLTADVGGSATTSSFVEAVIGNLQ